MRSNPYNKNLKEHVPLIMQGPGSTSVLNASSEQKNFVEKMMTPPKKTYQVKGVSFAMISPPILNLNATPNTPDLLKMEMGQTEVTQELFKAVMGWNDSKNKSHRRNPVEVVTWYDCISFCNKLSAVLGLEDCYKMLDVEMGDGDVHILQAEVTWDESKKGFRLPTEYEWGGFAKAGTNNRWSGTNNEDDLEQYAWYKKNSNGRTHPVAEKLPNEWGLYDMTGNVDEWCWDSYYEGDQRRTLCGGTYKDYPFDCSTDHHIWYFPDMSYESWGFRLCRSLG